MAGVVADTHTLIWYLTNRRRLSFPAWSALDATADSGDPVFVSAISLVEIMYLTEKGRLPKTVVERIDQELGNPDVALAIVPLDVSVARLIERIPREQVPDMPDRIIAATALHLGVPLVTWDGLIRASAIETVW